MRARPLTIEVGCSEMRSKMHTQEMYYITTRVDMSPCADGNLLPLFRHHTTGPAELRDPMLDG